MTFKAPSSFKFLRLQLAVVQWDIFESALKKGKYCIEVIVYGLEVMGSLLREPDFSYIYQDSLR